MVDGRGVKTEAAVKPLKAKGSHVEIVSAHPFPVHTLSEAFNRAHFSQILVSYIVSFVQNPTFGSVCKYIQYEIL